MKTLTEFLANYLRIPAENLRDAIEAYKKHLQNDSPKTIRWVMIERDLIIALEKMQSRDNLDNARHNNQNECESDLGKVKHHICPFMLYFEDDKDKCDISKCDFKNRSCTEACNKNSIRRL